MQYIAEIHLVDTHLLEKLRELATCIDCQGLEPSSFRYFQEERGILIHVHLGTKGHALALAQQFAGRVLNGSERARSAARLPITIMPKMAQNTP